MALVEFADGPLQGRQLDAPPDDDVLTVLAPLSGDPHITSVQVRYRRDGVSSDGLPLFRLL